MSIYLLDSTSKYAHMKRLLVIFFIFPVFAFIIPKKKNAASLGLLTKITSDTIKGQFNQIKIGYDPLKRVVSITQTSNQLDTLNKTGAKKNISNQLYKQEFIYEGNNIFPFSRKITSHKYAEGNKKNQVFAYLLQYFKYANGQRIGDSLITIMKDEKKNIGPLNNQLPESSPQLYKNITHASTYEVTANELNRKHKINLFDSKMRPGSSFIFLDHIEKETNLTKADYERLRYNNDVFGDHYKFLKYDQGLNPLQRLNIAPYIGSDLFDIQDYDFDTELFPYDSEPSCMSNNYLGWSFTNKNNPTIFIKHGNDRRTRDECRVTKTNELSYAYNAAKLPISCKVAVKTLMSYEDIPTSYDMIEYRKFYFEYR